MEQICTNCASLQQAWCTELQYNFFLIIKVMSPVTSVTVDVSSDANIQISSSSYVAWSGPLQSSRKGWHGGRRPAVGSERRANRSVRARGHSQLGPPERPARHPHLYLPQWQRVLWAGVSHLNISQIRWLTVNQLFGKIVKTYSILTHKQKICNCDFAELIKMPLTVCYNRMFFESLLPDFSSMLIVLYDRWSCLHCSSMKRTFLPKRRRTDRALGLGVALGSVFSTKRLRVSVSVWGVLKMNQEHSSAR